MSGFRIERDDASAPFFDAAADGRLLVRRCADCRRLFPPAQEQCPDGHELAWHETAGTATLVTWSVDHGPGVSPQLTAADGGGEVIAVVELDEGLWLHTAVPGVVPADLRAGMPMAVRFEALGDGEPVPVFVPSADGPAR